MNYIMIGTYWRSSSSGSISPAHPGGRRPSAMAEAGTCHGITGILVRQAGRAALEPPTRRRGTNHGDSTNHGDRRRCTSSRFHRFWISLLKRLMLAPAVRGRASENIHKFEREQTKGGNVRIALMDSPSSLASAYLSLRIFLFSSITCDKEATRFGECLRTNR